LKWNSNAEDDIEVIKVNTEGIKKSIHALENRTDIKVSKTGKNKKN
ncbi:16039_t:CDS:1, partial [Gigaspora margarita]